MHLDWSRIGRLSGKGSVIAIGLVGWSRIDIELGVRGWLWQTGRGYLAWVGGLAFCHGFALYWPDW